MSTGPEPRAERRDGAAVEAAVRLTSGDGIVTIKGS